jgi:uncharacterized protein YggE
MKQFILFTAIALFSISSFAQKQYPDELVIEGKSSIKLTPEQFIFNVRISATNENYTECANEVLRKAQEITDQFTKNGIDKDLIKTRNYSIREIREHDYKTNKSVFKGYRAEIPVIIKTVSGNPKNDVIFEIIKNNFNADFNLSFALTPEQKDEVKEKLIALAIEDAKQKAEIITENAGVKKYGIRHIQYGEPRLVGSYSHPNYDLQKESVMIRGASSTGGTSALNPTEIEMTTKVVIAWRI